MGVGSSSRRGALGGAAFAIAAATAAFAMTSREPVLEPLRLEVDASERELTVYHGGSVLETFPVAVGEPDHPTPKGSFSIDRIIWNPAWVPPNTEWAEDEERKAPGDPDNPMQAAKLFFEYPDYYIHGTNATHTLGQAESHGCIRMDPDAVERLGELVQEHGGANRSDAWYDRVKSSDTDKTEVELPNPVAIQIHS